MTSIKEESELKLKRSLNRWLLGLVGVILIGCTQNGLDIVDPGTTQPLLEEPNSIEVSAIPFETTSDTLISKVRTSQVKILKVKTGTSVNFVESKRRYDPIYFQNGHLFTIQESGRIESETSDAAFNDSAHHCKFQYRRAAENPATVELKENQDLYIQSIRINRNAQSIQFRIHKRGNLICKAGDTDVVTLGTFYGITGNYFELIVGNFPEL